MNTDDSTYIRTLETDPIPGWQLWADIWHHADGTFGYTVQATDQPYSDAAQAPYLDAADGIASETDANTAADLALRNVADGLRRAIK